MSSEIGSFVVSLKAKFEGYLSEVEKIKKAMSQVGADTKLGKNLAKELATVEKQVDALGRKLNQRISSEGLIVRLKDLLDGLDNKIKLIGLSLLGVKYEDLSPDYITNKFKDLESELDNIGKKMLSNFNLDSLKGNEKLVLLFKDLGISIKDVNLDNFKSTLTSALDEYKKKASEYREEIVRLKKELQDLNRKTEGKELFADGGAAKVASKLMEGIDPNSFKMVSLDTVENMKQSLMSAVDTFDNKELAEKLKAQLEQSFNVTDAGTLANNLKTLLKDMVTAAGGDLEKNTQTFLREKLNAALSSLGSEFNLNDILNFKNYTEADTAVLDTVRLRLTELLKVNDNLNKNGDLTTAFIEKLMGVFANGDYAAAIRNIVLALDYYVNAINRAKALNLEDLLVATNGRDDANLISLRIAGIINGYKSLIEILLKENAELKDQLHLSKEKATEEPRATGGAVERSSNEGLAENTRLVRQYTQELESAKNAELMVGKIEGITQRWFSVYAAVRMVTNAINSMKQTIAELDKTITEIAIVTDMSQSDLWGLMDSYTSMAREYAASISGVYKVSQLYYQQGLQTADVMALTESTLKMARISGLDYADATNYMTNAVRSFKMEMSEADKVVDVYSAIAAKSATDVSELAVAMSKTASSAEAVGSSFENTAAMMAVMIEATRESSLNIGSAMKSIISRYGELKEDPSKLVDSEGEELSLNKVDTALQSVGISIHNAQGQFREFDDVIMELAEAWDTIDVNTLRYIATVMAGNRQQSRFLALVGSGERLKQLATEAADAENASQLQFLKTLDSIEAKSQLLLTSLLSLYTSSGLEGFYKGILDITNNIISSFTAMPTVMNLPIAAIAKFGMTFWSLANVVKSVFAVMVNEIQIWKMKTVLQSEQATSKIITDGTKEITAENNKLASIFLTISNWLNRRKALYDEYYNEINNKKINNELETDGANILKQKLYSTAALGFNVAALGLNLIGGNLKASADANLQRIGGGLSIAGSAASGAAMGAFAGPEGMVIGAIAGAAMGALLNWNVLAQDIETRLANAKKASEEANNKALQELAEAKSLLSSIDKLKELEKARYDSVEAELAYLEANSALATKYPELINSYAETGEAIINLDSATNLLTASLELVVKATEDASTANVKLALMRYEKELNEIDLIRGTNNAERLEKNASVYEALRNDASLDDSIKTIISLYSDVLSFLGAGISDTFSGELNIDFNKDFLEKYFNSYLNNSLSEFINLRPEIDSSVLNDAEQVIYQFIEGQINAFASTDSRETANNKKLLTTIKANILNDVNSYINLIRQVEDSNPFEGMDEASAIIKNYIGLSFNIDEINTIEEWNKALDSAQEATQEYYDALVNWYSSIDKETYKNIMSFKGLVSSNTLINMLKASFGKIPEEILKGFSETYKDEFDRIKYLLAVGKIDNSEIKNVLAGINIRVFNQLSDAERHAILDYGKLIESLIAGGLITENLGLESLNKYMAIWSELRIADIAPELREAAEGLLRAWDGTREGLEGIITSLDGIGCANSIINAVRDLISSIPLNLNTIFSQISTSIASEIKTMDDAIKDLSSGVDMEKAVEYANKLGLSLKDFKLDYSTGLFTLTDTQKIILKLVDNVNKLIGNALKELDKYLNATNDELENLNNIDRDSLEAYSKITDLSNDNDNTVKAFKAVAGLFNLEPGKLLPLIQEFFEQSNEVINGGFLEWLKTKFGSDIESLTDISKNAQARGALLVGDLNGFLKLMGVNESKYNEVILSLLSNNGFNYEDIKKIAGPTIADEMQKYATAISEALGDVTKNAVDAAISSITNGKVENIKVNQANEDILKKLGATGIDSGSATLDWSDTDINNYQARVNLILTSGLSPKDMDSALSSLESAVYNIDISEAINSVISSYEEFGIEAANTFALATGKSLSVLLSAGILSFNKLTGKYSANIEKLRIIIARQENLSNKDLNAMLANIDKQIRETSGISVFNNIAKDYNNLTEESIQLLADKLELSYDTIKDSLTPNGDGTYKVDLARLQQLQQDLGAAADNNAKETIASIIDEYISLLTNISQIQSSGYTSLADMLKVADELGTTTDSIFEWDNNLKAYILSTAGIGLQAKHSKEELSKINDPALRAQAVKLIESNALTLAGAIDYKTLISSLSDGTFEKQAEIFRKSVVDYNNFLVQFGEHNLLLPSELINNIKEGGMDGLKAAWTIAKRAGEDLTGEDVESIYRSGAERILTALSLMNLSIGSVIDETSVELLGIGDNVVNLGGGKAVITSAVNLVEAHKKLYEKMKEDNTSTLEELNNLAALLDMDAAQADLIDSLKGVNDLTYTTLAKIASEAGIEYNTLKALLENAGAIEHIGGGHLQLNDFDFFASLIGITEKGTDYYIELLSAANDAFISSNSNRADKVVSQLKTLSESSAGQDVNIAYLSNLINDGIAQKLEDLGAIYHDGILSLGPNAKIGAITSLLGNLAQDIEGITEQDMAEIADAIDAFLKSIADSINNGIKGTLSNSNRAALQENLNSEYGIQLDDKDFVKTADGWLLIEKSAIHVWNVLKDIDDIQSDLVFKEMSQAVVKNNEQYSSMATTVGRIRELLIQTGDYFKQFNGNVDLMNRPIINNEDGSFSTLLTESIDPRNYGKEAIDFPFVLNMTPITPDGQLLDENSFNEYVQGIIDSGASTIDEIKAADTLGLLIEALNVGDGFESANEATKLLELTLEQAAQRAEDLHLAAEDYEENVRNNDQFTDEHVALLREELALAKEIAMTRATSKDDSFAFMSGKLPEAMENPLTYAENWGKAILTIQLGNKSGYIDARDWYNIVNELNNIAKISGQDIEFYGQLIQGNLQSASDAIQAGFNALKAVDGGQLKVDLGLLGASFEAGSIEMKGSITEGIHAMAKSLMEMLDGLIAVLETVVAMQEAFLGLDDNANDLLDFGELFDTVFAPFMGEDIPTGNFVASEKFVESANTMLNKFAGWEKDLNNPLSQIKINGQKLGELFREAAKGTEFTKNEADAMTAAMNALYQASLSGNYDLDNIYESVISVLKLSNVLNGEMKIDIGTTTIYLTGNVLVSYDWDSDKVKTAMDKAYGNHKKGAKEKAEAAIEKWLNDPITVTGKDLEFILRSNPDVTVELGENGKETGKYIVDGHALTPEEAKKALILKQVSKLSKINVDKNGNVTGTTITGSHGVSMETTLTETGKHYKFIGDDGGTGESDVSMEDAIRNYWAKRDNITPEEVSLDKVLGSSINLGLEGTMGITLGEKDKNGNIKPGTDKLTTQLSKDLMDILNDPKMETLKDIKEAANGKGIPLNISPEIEGDAATIKDLLTIAKLAGGEYSLETKSLSLSVTTSETPEPLATLITTGTATATLEITPTTVGSTTSGEGTKNGLLLGEQLINAPIRINPTDVQLNGNTFLYDKALTVYAAVSNLKLLSGEGGTTAVEGGTGNPLSEQAKTLLKLIVDSIWNDETRTYSTKLQALAYLGEILFETNEATVNTPPKIVVPQDWIGEKSLLKVDKILTFLYDLEYKPTEAAKAETILVDTPGPLETIDIEQPYRIVFVPEGEGGDNEPQPTGLATDADWIQGGIIAGDSKYSDYLTSMSQYLQKGGALSQAGANSISLIANATEVNPETQEFYERFFGKDGGLFNIDELGNISAMTTLLLDMGEALSDGELIGNMLNLSTLVLEVNSTDSNGLAALWTVLTELKDAAATFMQGPWKDVTSVLNDLSSLTLEAKTLTIDTVLTGQVWALELLKDLSSSTMNLNLNLGGTTTVPPQGPLAGLVPATYPAGTMTTASLLGGMTGSYGWTGTGQVPGTQWMGGAYSSATPTTPTTGEQPKLNTDELEKGIEKVNELISNISTSMDNIAKAASEFTSQADAVSGAVSNIGSEVSTLQGSISTLSSDAGTGASNAEAAAKALKGIPKNIPIKAKVDLSVTASLAGGTAPAKGGKLSVEVGNVELEKSEFVLSQAKGSNLALPKGNAQTLMGELGPELYVTNGKYYVAGQSGPEFVDLPKDAIVFNHVKTRLLLKNGKTSGHGKPVTNEKNAISFATGTPGGPAMASASAALAALKQLRAMWASLLKSSAKDLGSLAGRGGGGGGDDAGKYVQPTTTTADIQRWYNWLRLIDKIEKDITYQEKLQKKYETDRVANGLKIFDTLKERLKLLDQEILRNERLADLQKSWYDNKRKELEESSYGKIFTYDENGLQQYVGSGKPGSGLGLDILEHLTKRDVRGEAIGDAATSKAQLKYLASVGFNLNDLIYNDDGTKVVKKINQKTLGLTRMPDDEDTDASELYTKLMENFWSRVDGWRDELDSLYDSYQQQLAKIEDNQTKLNLIIEGFVKNELSVEKELLKAVEAREQAVIDKLQEQKDALEKANANYIKGILKALEKERQIELKNDLQENLTKLQRQLSILQRSGGGAAQIKQLQDQIALSLKDMYFNDRLEEINAVQEASDKLLEKLDLQIQILSETLEYQKKNGLLWNQVREIMEGGDEFATAFYDKWVTSKSGESALNMEEDLRAFKESFLEWVGFRESKEEDRLAKEDMESIANSEKYGESNANYLEGFTDDKERSAAQKAAEDAANTARDNYLKSHEDEDEASREANARAAAEKAYHESLQSSYMSTTGNKEANQLFAENYGSWLENRRISDANDFTNTETFKLNENVFKNAMQAYYLEHRNDEGVSEQELWENAINAGLLALEEDITENYDEATKNSAQVIGGKAVSYTWDSVKGKMKKNSKITYGEGTSLNFDDAKEVLEGKKLKHYLHVKGMGDNGWVLANSIYTGERIYSLLAGYPAWLGRNGNLADMISGMNGYYGANGLTNTVDISDLKSGSLKFPGTLIPLENGGFATLGKNGNTVRISDFSSITFDKKNPDKKISKLGKNMTITAILTPDMSKMENLLNPMTIKTNGTIKKKLNDLLAADRGSLKNLLQYLGNYDISEIRRYAAGGMNYSTGPAWLDGTKTRPEAVLNSSLTSFLRNDLLGNSKDSLKSIVYSLQDSIRGAAIGSSSTTNNDGMVIENIDVTFSPGVISNDYDMRQASEVFKNEIVKIARKSGSRSVSRR